MQRSFRSLTALAAMVAVGACSAKSTQSPTPMSSAPSSLMPAPMPLPPSPPQPDGRVGLKAGLADAGEAIGNLKVTAKVASPPGFLGVTNSDLAFTGNYAIQGNYNGLQVWDISNADKPTLVTAFPCPASQNDVSVYKNLLFMSAEAGNGRLDCGAGGVKEAVSKDRIRGVRIFDISDIKKPKLVASVQTCRGSHTHTVLESPADKQNIYIYVSGSSPIRSADELPGCVSATPDKDPNSSLLRIEVIKVPLAHPEQAAIVNRADIFSGLKTTLSHGETEADKKAGEEAAAKARAAGQYVATIPGMGTLVAPAAFTKPMLDSIAKANGRSTVTAADSAQLRGAFQGIVEKMVGGGARAKNGDPISTGRQCHDITVYPAKGLAGGACEGHGILIDISDPAKPTRITAVADSNFSYWHSATFNNDGTKILFSDEWGGGGAPKCRSTDPKEWGSDAIFAIEGRTLKFESYYKLPAQQTDKENCVAHNGSLIPIPGRDVMVQAWYQGGISVFDWTDAKHPQEIAYFDRGPVDGEKFTMGGSWSVYWYNGKIVSSEIARGLDVAQLVPSPYLTQNEIDAANTVQWNYLNAQGQPQIVWPASFALARAYLDQLERNKCLSADRLAAVRGSLSTAERASGAARTQTLSTLVSQLDADAKGSCDAWRVHKVRDAVSQLGTAVVP